MNGALAKEQRRNLLKAYGVDVVDTIERCIKTATTLETQHRALAQEMIALQKKHAADLAALTGRADAAAAWCDKNERAIVETRRDYVPNGVTATFSRRLHWLLYGSWR